MRRKKLGSVKELLQRIDRGEKLVSPPSNGCTAKDISEQKMLATSRRRPAKTDWLFIDFTEKGRQLLIS